MTDGLKPRHVGELHGKLLVSFLGLIGLALRPEQVTQTHLRQRSSFAGGEFARDALKNGLRFLAFAHGIELGAEAEQRKNSQWIAGVLGGEFLEGFHCGGFLVLIPQQIRFQQQRIGGSDGARIARDDRITVLHCFGTRESFRSLIGLELVLMMNKGEGTERSHHDDEKPDELAGVVFEELFHANSREFLGGGIELGHTGQFLESSERLVQKNNEGKRSQSPIKVTGHSGLIRYCEAHAPTLARASSASAVER